MRKISCFFVFMLILTCLVRKIKANMYYYAHPLSLIRPMSIAFKLVFSHFFLLNTLLLFYKTHSVWHIILEEINAIKHTFSPYFQFCRLHFRSIFKHVAFILHHFAFLVWLQVRNFSCPNPHFYPLKPHFLMYVLPHLSHILMDRRGFVYAI